MQNNRFAPHRDIYRRLRSGLENAPDVLDEPDSLRRHRQKCQHLGDVIYRASGE